MAGDAVPEGNRRLAALRILSNETLRGRLRIGLPFEPNSKALPESVRVRAASDPEARDFIGFKHVNGTFKWDALARGKYAADWFAEDGDIGRVSRRLGDNRHTVGSTSWHVPLQSYDAGFAQRPSDHSPFRILGGESERATVIYLGRVVRERRRQPTSPGIRDEAPAERGNESRLHRPEGDNVDGDYFRRVYAGARCGVRGSRRGGSSRARLSARAACRRRRSAKFLAMVMQEFHGDQRRRPSQWLARRSAFRWRRPKPEFRGAVSKGGGVSGMLKRPGSRTVPWKIGSMRGPPPEKGWFDALNQEQSRGGAAAGSRRGTSGEGR